MKNYKYPDIKNEPEKKNQKGRGSQKGNTKFNLSRQNTQEEQPRTARRVASHGRGGRRRLLESRRPTPGPRPVPLTAWATERTEGRETALSHVRLVRPHGPQPASLLCLWDSPDRSTGVGCHSLLQGNFPTQELNPGLPHCRVNPNLETNLPRPLRQSVTAVADRSNPQKAESLRKSAQLGAFHHLRLMTLLPRI